jgi:hypothetical protein
LSQQRTAIRAQGETPQEHEEDRHRLFNDKNTISQKAVNGLQKVEKIIEAPSDDLGFPEGPQIQDILSTHE